MKAIQTTFKYMRAHKLIAVFIALLLAVGIHNAIEALTPAKEIALTIGEPWVDMQQRSTATIGPVYEGRHWYREPDELAYMRFADPKHGFVTPPAKFFTVNFDDEGRIDGIRMSPQLEPLPLQEALDIVLDLQNQWRENDWSLMYPERNPPYDRSPALIQQLEECNSTATYWKVEKPYQIMMILTCFGEQDESAKNRYLITLSMGRPWH